MTEKGPTLPEEETPDLRGDIHVDSKDETFKVKLGSKVSYAEVFDNNSLGDPEFCVIVPVTAKSDNWEDNWVTIQTPLATALLGCEVGDTTLVESKSSYKVLIQGIDNSEQDKFRSL